MFPAILIVSCISAVARTLTLPLNNTTLDLDTPVTYDNSNTSIIHLPTANLSSGGISLQGWHYTPKWGNSQLCATALFVVAGHALASITAADLASPATSSTFIVRDYDEVNIKINIYSDVLSRERVAGTLYQILRTMKIMDRWISSKWSIYLDNAQIGRVDMNGGTRRGEFCMSESVAESMSSEVSENNSTVASNTREEAIRKSQTIRIGADDDDPNLELECQWDGDGMNPFTEIMAPLYILAYEPFSDSGLDTPAPVHMFLSAPPLGVSFIIKNLQDPNAPRTDFTLYHIIKSLGKMPKAMADNDPFVWREMNAFIKLDGDIVGVIQLVQGNIVGGSGAKSTVEENSMNATLLIEGVSDSRI